MSYNKRYKSLEEAYENRGEFSDLQDDKKFQSYVRARERMEELKAFYIHLITYLAVNPFLIFINYMTYWDYQWFWYSLIGWGIGLAAHAFVVFGFGSGWEERKIQELMKNDELNSDSYDTK